MHFAGIQKWRRHDLESYLAGRIPRSLPPSDRVGDGDNGDTCASNREGYQCKSGFRCDTTHSMNPDHTTGECVDAAPASNIGQACDPSTLISESQPLLDHVTDKVLESAVCGDGSICASARAGFPGGFCSSDCKSNEASLCVAVPVLGDFSVCLHETGRFRDCANKHNMRVLMPRCQHNSDCRQDYACVNDSAAAGYCAPPYFLPDLTLGHHPALPETAGK